MNDKEHFSVGSVHGRFQPLHKGHLEYLLAAKECCEFLWVGVTQFDVAALQESPLDRHRQDPSSNPLTYFERVEMIRDVMLEAGVDWGQFGILPFPVDRPASLANFLPTSIPVFTTICEPWNDYKIGLLKTAGYRVVVLWERHEKVYEGINVRHSIRVGDDAWRDMVPPASAKLVDRYNIAERLRSLSRPHGVSV